MDNYLSYDKKSAGFTVLELLMTIAIASILMTVAVPSFRTMILNNRMTANVNDVVSALHLARSEAIRRNLKVSLCVSNANGDNCSANIADTMSTNGWLVITDRGVLGTIDGTDTILRNYPPIDTADFNITYNNGLFVAFNGMGFNSNVTNGTFQFCDARGNQAGAARNIIVSPSGRVQSVVATAPNC